MAKMYLPVIAPKDYEAFRKILRDEIPSNYAEWRRDVDKWQAAHRAQQDTIIEVEISPNSFADYLRQNDYAPGLKRLVGFSADQGEVIAGRQVAVTVCRQSISDNWLGNLRECLAHLV